MQYISPTLTIKPFTLSEVRNLYGLKKTIKALEWLGGP